MSLVKQDWAKLEDTIKGESPLEAIWYMTGNEGNGEPRYPVPACIPFYEYWDGEMRRIYKTHKT